MTFPADAVTSIMAPPLRAIIDSNEFPRDADIPMQTLNDNGVHSGSLYYDPEFPLDEVNLKTAMMNQPRHELIDNDHLESLTTAKRQGAVFPALILRKVGPNRYVLVDGRHRARATSAARGKTHGAIVIDCTDETAEDIANDINLRNGKQQNPTEKLTWAKHLTTRTNNPLSVSKAAEKAKITTKRLQTYLRTAEGADRAGQNGISQEWTRLNETKQSSLTTVQNNRPFKQACILALDADLTSDEVQKLVGDLRLVADNDLQLACLDTERARLDSRIQDVAAGQAAIRRPHAQTIAGLRRASTMINPEVLNLKVTSQAHKAEVLAVLDELTADIRKARRTLVAVTPVQ